MSRGIAKLAAAFALGAMCGLGGPTDPRGTIVRQELQIVNKKLPGAAIPQQLSEGSMGEGVMRDSGADHIRRQVLGLKGQGGSMDAGGGVAGRRQG